jgi:hypothetical protein
MTRYEKIKADPIKYAAHKARAAAWAKANKDKFTESQKKHRQGNGRERINAWQRARYANNPEFREKMAAYQDKYRNTPQGMIRTRLRRAVSCTRYGQNGKYARFLDVCSGMPGQIQALDTDHVDHILPLVAFDLFDSVQLRKAIHHTNIRGVSGYENISKGDSYEPFDMDALPYVDTEEARREANMFLFYALRIAERLQPRAE